MMKNKINSKVLILLSLVSVLQVKSNEIPVPLYLRNSSSTPALHYPILRYFVANPAYMAGLPPEVLSELRERGQSFVNSFCDALCQSHNLHTWLARAYTINENGDQDYHCICEKRGTKRRLDEFDVDTELARAMKRLELINM